MNSEKVKEIKKVLECCYILTNKDLPMETRDNACNNCPYYGIERCSPLLVKNSLTYINELENCIANLEKENMILQGTKNRLTFTDRIKIADNARTIALKQFAERVKMEFYYHFDELIPSIMSDKIDKILKELIGEWEK